METNHNKDVSILDAKSPLAANVETTLYGGSPTFSKILNNSVFSSFSSIAIISNFLSGY